ncbi:MAG: hypothetical protein AB7O24_30625 [Kofleriaceae bacterium]
MSSICTLIWIASLIALAACKNPDRETPMSSGSGHGSATTAAPSTVPAPTSIKMPPQFNLAITASRTSQVDTPELTVEPLAKPVVNYAEEKLHEILNQEKLDDGVFLKVDAGLQKLFLIERTVAGFRLLCTGVVDDENEKLVRNACAAVRIDGDRIHVPLIVRSDDKAHVGVGTSKLLISLTDADSPGSAEQATKSASGVKVLATESVPDGFAVAYEHVISNKPRYSAERRAKIGTLDVMCEALVPESAQAARDALAICKGLSAPSH